MSELFKPLFAPHLHLKSRLIMPPMATHKLLSTNGRVNDDLVAYYDEKTKGGYLGAAIIEHSYITPQGQAGAGQLSVADDDTIEGISRLAKVIHDNGCKAIMQINHSGSMAKTEITGMEPVGPSAIAPPGSDVVPRELSLEDIATLIEQFKAAALRVVEAGFDGVEIHSCHAYLLNQFLSPLTNRRSDAYGGDINRRMQMHLDVISAVRAAVGDKFPILLRLAADDYTPDGITIEDGKTAAIAFEKAGVDILDISAGFSRYIVPGLEGQGYFAPLSEAIKEVVDIPVIVTGGITDPFAAEKLVRERKADMVGVGRALLNDSLWAKKAYEALVK